MAPWGDKAARDGAARDWSAWRRDAKAIAAVLVLAIGGLGIVALVDPGFRDELGFGPRADDLYGRLFVSTEIVEDGKRLELLDGTRMSFRVSLDGRVSTDVGVCHSHGGLWDLDEGRLDFGKRLAWSPLSPGCEPTEEAQASWFTGFLLGRPTWHLDGDTLTLTSEWRTLGEVDRTDRPPPAGKRERNSTTVTLVEQLQNNVDPADLRETTFISYPSVEGGPIRHVNRHLWLEFGADDTARAITECYRSDTVGTVGEGRLEFDGLDAEPTGTCARSLGEHDEWLWDFLDGELRWQFADGGLQVMSGSTMLWFGEPGRFNQPHHASPGR